MKSLILVATTILLTTTSAQCRLGETLEQLTARFGEGKRNVGHIRMPGHEQYTFEKDGLAVDCVFKDGKVIMEVYRRAKTFDERAVKDILKAQGEKLSWRFDKKSSKYIRSDKMLEAYHLAGHDNVFYVRVVPDNEGSAKTKKGLDGI